MSRKSILIVAMLDSVHTVKWVTRFAEEGIDIYLFPSRRFRKLHSEISSLIQGDSYSSYYLVRSFPLSTLTPFWDFLLFEIIGKAIGYFSRSRYLSRHLKKKSYSFIHALEFQSAGYLCASAMQDTKATSEFIVTNWGSDLYFYQDDSYHKSKLIELLGIANRYSAECARDYLLASDLGFRGQNLPLIPNSAFFDKDFINACRSNPSAGHHVVAKTYGGKFGLGNLVIELMHKALEVDPRVTCLLYSVSPDMYDQAHALLGEYAGRVEISTVAHPIKHDALMDQFRKSRIYIGCSRSDGVSTSFLEALATGAYPIQTNTSCADEWVEKGAVASIVSLSKQDIWKELQNALIDDYLVDSAFLANRRICQEWLSPERLMNSSRLFYDL